MSLGLALACSPGVASEPDKTLIVQADAQPDQADTRPLVGGVASLDALGQAATTALNERDAAALQRLVVDESEFKGRLFAALSNHPNAAQMGPGLIWELQQREGADELARGLEHFGGKDWRYVGLEVERVEDRGSVKLHRRPGLVVEDAQGQQRVLKFLGSVVEHQPSGTFSLVTFKFRPA